MGFIFEPNLDGLRNLAGDPLQWFSFVIVDVRVRRYPDRVDDPVDDTPPARFYRCFVVSRIS